MSKCNSWIIFTTVIAIGQSTFLVSSQPIESNKILFKNITNKKIKNIKSKSRIQTSKSNI